jgi:hypothetical protein
MTLNPGVSIDQLISIVLPAPGRTVEEEANLKGNTK